MKGCLVLQQNDKSKLLKTKNLDQTLKSNTGVLQIYIQTETNEQTDQLYFTIIQQLCSLKTYELNLKHLTFPTDDSQYLESVLELCQIFQLQYITDYTPQDPRTVYKKIYYQNHKSVMKEQIYVSRQKRLPLSQKQLKEQLLLVLIE